MKITARQSVQTKFYDMDRIKRSALITKVKIRIQKIIDELARLQKEKDEESLVRLSDLTQQRDKLMNKLRELTEINLSPAKSKTLNRIDVGTSVVLRKGTTDFEVSLVRDFAVDSSNGDISVSSPLGSGLLNKRTGEMVEVDTPAGPMEYEILEIK